MYAFCSCVLQVCTFCTKSATCQAGSCMYALQYASDQLPRHHFKTATYAMQKPEMEEKTLCCQRRLRDAKTCFVFFRRLGIPFPGVVTRQYFTVPSRHHWGRSDPSNNAGKTCFTFWKPALHNEGGEQMLWSWLLTKFTTLCDIHGKLQCGEKKPTDLLSPTAVLILLSDCDRYENVCQRSCHNCLL